MKKFLFVTVSIIFTLFISIKPVYADETDKNDNFDNSINEILEGINEEDFTELTDLLNDFLGEEKTLKEWIIDFLTGEKGFTIDGFKDFLSGAFNGVLGSVIELVSYVLFIGILYTVLNVIICKKTDNNGNNIIYFICYSLIVTLFVYIVSKILTTATQSVENMSSVVELSFPLLITLGDFCGGFGVGLYKPITAISSFLSSVLFKELFIPVISTCFVCVIVGNISPDLKLNNLSKTLISLLKWIMGIITLVLGLILSAQGMVNSQYSGLSFKILKYATGSIIPIVGNFISGGMDVLLSSAIIVKNSFGLILVVFLFFVAMRSGITILITSFVLRFFISLAELLLDGKFVTLTNGICEVLNVLCATVFISGFSYIFVCLTVINSTALII